MFGYFSPPTSNGHGTPLYGSLAEKVQYSITVMECKRNPAQDVILGLQSPRKKKPLSSPIISVVITGPSLGSSVVRKCNF